MWIGTTQLLLRQGDITLQTVDAIVNAANSSLMGGGGVDGAIHRAGGPDIMRELRTIRDRQGGCPTGEAVITRAGLLRARHVVHTVGPVWQGGATGEANLLRSAYLSSLRLAAAHGARTIAFPSISTGVYGYPIERAAPVALGAVREYALKHGQFNEIRFVLFSDRDFQVYRQALEQLG